MTAQSPHIPALVVGGNGNALSVARSLGRRSIPVYLLSAADVTARHSRYVRFLDLGPTGQSDTAQAMADYLLGPRADHLEGAVLFAGSDPAIQALIAHHGSLAERYRLDLFDPGAAEAMLDKVATYEIARRAGVPTPGFRPITASGALDDSGTELRFPAIVKPTYTHVFEKAFGRKYLLVADRAALDDGLEVLASTGMSGLVVEYIPGADTELCSYYTYLDERGEALFDFTKRIIRRNPPGMGLASYHITDEVPEIREPALRLIRAAGLRGLANVEFKYDARDGVHKLMECNARLTASNALVDRAGHDLAGFVYDRLVGADPQAPSTQAVGLTMWDPLRDLGAWRQLQRAGEMSFGEWVRSISRRHAVVGQFARDDPRPGLAQVATKARSLLGR